MRNEVITFKVDKALRDALKGIPNRSDFIREAVLAALDNACPVCLGRGVLSPGQKKHWRDFLESHAVVECEQCHEAHLVCDVSREKTKDHCHE